uniref:Uncharacterized protein n=1 Tax=Cacopsylla melanoneura TaxID=428564 RepID=A0A8D9BA93_9HEMI
MNVVYRASGRAANEMIGPKRDANTSVWQSPEGKRVRRVTAICVVHVMEWGRTIAGGHLAKRITGRSLVVSNMRGEKRAKWNVPQLMPDQNPTNTNAVREGYHLPG